MTYRLADHGRVFSTRDRGARVGAEICELAKQDGQIVVDLADVISVSYSFVDELVSSLTELIKADRLEFANVPPQAARTIERSLKRRGLSEDCLLAAA
jgi:STAS-like domain of unknown function (DUF4325)